MVLVPKVVLTLFTIIFYAVSINFPEISNVKELGLTSSHMTLCQAPGVREKHFLENIQYLVPMHIYYMQMVFLFTKHRHWQCFQFATWKCQQYVHCIKMKNFLATPACFQDLNFLMTQQTRIYLGTQSNPQL